MTSNPDVDFYLALSKVIKEIPKLFFDKTNPHFKNRYITLSGVIEAIDPVLEANGFILLAPAHNGAIELRLIHIETGQCDVARYEYDSNLPAQQVAGATTYARRYALMCYFNLAAEDDDGNLASTPHTTENGPASTRSSRRTNR
jgi:hypothetical protein